MTRHARSSPDADALIDVTRGEIWKPYTVVDRNLYTGQNPASAAPLAEHVLAALH
jgi:putative intracellular protease/amidase